MTERPILFSGEMVRAILEGRKTQTRCVIKPQPKLDSDQTDELMIEAWEAGFIDVKCPYGQPGDRLWVREAMHKREGWPWGYRADNALIEVAQENKTAMLVWAHHKDIDSCPSIHMPRWASRFTLEITKVRVERVQQISAADAIAEGCECRAHFKSAWDKLNAKLAWHDNPWVWVIEFRRLT